MCRVVVVRPGATSFDEQERIKGCLDMPLSSHGLEQVQRVASEMEQIPIRYVYCGPCESAQETARQIAEHVNAKWKVCDCFSNIDHGLWEGKLIDEVRRQQPKLFRQVQENPRSVSRSKSRSCAKNIRERPLPSLFLNRLLHSLRAA